MSAISDRHDPEYSKALRQHQEWMRWMRQEVQNPARPESEREKLRDMIQWVETMWAESEHPQNAPSHKKQKRTSASNVVGAVLLILVALALWPVWLLLAFILNLVSGG